MVWMFWTQWWNLDVKFSVKFRCVKVFFWRSGILVLELIPFLLSHNMVKLVNWKQFPLKKVEILKGFRSFSRMPTNGYLKVSKGLKGVDVEPLPSYTLSHPGLKITTSMSALGTICLIELYLSLITLFHPSFLCLCCDTLPRCATCNTTKLWCTQFLTGVQPEVTYKIGNHREHSYQAQRAELWRPYLAHTRIKPMVSYLHTKMLQAFQPFSHLLAPSSFFILLILVIILL